MKWMKAEGAVLEPEGFYLVKTNGGEWRDIDLFVMRGWEVTFKLGPNFVRGRPVWVARITEPEAAIQQLAS